jgi:hypothetical protein
MTTLGRVGVPENNVALTEAEYASAVCNFWSSFESNLSGEVWIWIAELSFMREAAR